MSRADAFLAAFSAIEKHLRRETRSDSRVSFYQLVEVAAQRDRAVLQLREDLKEFADLRNAIVHERSDGHPIAEPIDAAVQHLERIRALLLSPPTIYPTFRRAVESVEASDPIAKALTIMRARRFSQLPVTRERRFIGLLTASTVARWLAERASEEVLDLRETCVKDALAHAEDPENHQFVKRDATVFDALACFDLAETRGKRLEALLITHSGKPSETFLGIITVHDVPRLLAATRAKRGMRGKQDSG
jgi:predicted transcriptional regulator